jgi:hypothetical protein
MALLWRSHSNGTEVKRLPDQEYRRAIDLSRKIAADVGTPRFYLEQKGEVALSRKWLDAEPLIKET